MILLRRRVLRLVPVVAVAAVTGCSSPVTTYYRLQPVAGAVLRSVPVTLQVRNIGVPAYLNQNGIAEPSAEYQFLPAANALWAEPLPDMLQAVLVQDLAQRLPAMTVTGSNGAVGTPADLLIEIQIQRFDPDASGRVTLQAQVALKAVLDNRFVTTQTLQLSALPGSTDITATVAAMSGLWAGLADQLARIAGAQVV